MKYLVLNTYPAVAIPLEALEACGDLLLLESEYRSGGKVYWESTGRRIEGDILDKAALLPAKPEPEEPSP